MKKPILKTGLQADGPEVLNKKEILLNSIQEDIKQIGILTLGVSFSEKDDMDFLEMYSKLARNRVNYLARASKKKAFGIIPPNIQD
tara:strand:- start:29 stop:286 length:258 start_codon:yes stop_codon:yes gene_type:complete